MRHAPALLLGLICYATIAGAQDLHRATIWDLKIGQPIAAQPTPDDFGSFACGANGGPPRQPLSGWSDFMRCPAEPGGLHEVYFDYDDEYEYVARARGLPREIARWAGTTEAGFPVMASALFDDAGVLRAIRIVTDPRPDYRKDATEADLQKRAGAYLFGAVMAARHGIEAARDCASLPAAEGESAVGSLFVKLACELTDRTRGLTILLRTSYFRKPGQSGVNPQLPTQLTQGQYESSARLEIRELVSGHR
jgi:hypothetical protein